MADSRRTLVIASILIMTATALGAFGTHALKPILTAARFESFETGVTYQFFHALGLLAIGVLQRDPRFDGPRLRASVRLLLVGIFLFAGSIYALTAGAPRWFGMVAPFGGGSLMAAWLLFAWAVVRPAEGAAREAPVAGGVSRAS
ncbi:MAG: DUF423 domain-containing protein [Steroidobacteraceae bacterium]|jgi:uncharacterized membrane protein YgdD (TMEM256/DUF423 family)|nr:DUF423 domain-containing protein [Steroidobacteraceae bacterium]